MELSSSLLGVMEVLVLEMEQNASRRSCVLVSDLDEYGSRDWRKVCRCLDPPTISAEKETLRTDMLLGMMKLLTDCWPWASMSSIQYPIDCES